MPTDPSSNTSHRSTRAQRQRQRTAVHAHWAALTAQLALDWNDNEQRLQGKIDGFIVHVSLVPRLKKGLLRTSAGWDTRIEVTAKAVLHGLASVYETGTETLRSMIGIRDIQLHETSLNDRYRITGASPSQVRAVLTDPAVLPLLRSPEGLHLEEGWVIHTTSGPATDDLQARMHAAISIADILVHALHRFNDRLAASAPLTPTIDYYRNLPIFVGTVREVSVAMVRTPDDEGLYIVASDSEAVRPRLFESIRAYRTGESPDGYACVHLSEVDPAPVASAIDLALDTLKIKHERHAVKRQTKQSAEAQWSLAVTKKWSPVTTRLALTPSRDLERNAPRFDGTVKGVGVAARRHSLERNRYDVTVAIDPPLPARLSIHSASKASHHSCIPLGDPILDSTICVSPQMFGNEHHTASSLRDVARKELSRDEVRGNLLALIMPFPRTYISDREIYVPVEQVTPKLLAQAIHAAVLLARALSIETPQENTP
ncbi:MAG: hypothetical protein CL927_18250 [Deltaproteobacteria bacterium]|nr:hypothetical protein [Deltaproteobacteria bacterium]HCH62821.1 hypothetical protein [Deltaproteobacteria bacterium]